MAAGRAEAMNKVYPKPQRQKSRVRSTHHKAAR